MTANTTIQSTRRPATDVVFPGQISAEITTLRVAWGNLMDTGRFPEADFLLDALTGDTEDEAIRNGLYELESIERVGRKIVDAETQARFEEHVNLCAKNLFGDKPNASRVFVDRAIAIGWGGNDPIGQAKQAAEAWLKPAPKAPRQGRTATTQASAHQRLARSRDRVARDRELVERQRTGTGARG